MKIRTMHRLSFLVLSLCASLLMWAQTDITDHATPLEQETQSQTTDSVSASMLRPYILDFMPRVLVRQDSLIERLLKEKIYGRSATMQMDGYRVQIFSSNRQQTAKEEALNLEKKITEAVSVSVYVQYVAPFWKVRLGNFRTMEEANAYKQVLLTQFPDLQAETYVVRDVIEVKK